MVRIHLRCEMFDGDMGLIDGNLEVLVASGGHLERGSVGEEKIWVGGTTKKGLRNDSVHNPLKDIMGKKNQGNEES